MENQFVRRRIRFGICLCVQNAGRNAKSAIDNARVGQPQAAYRLRVAHFRRYPWQLDAGIWLRHSAFEPGLPPFNRKSQIGVTPQRLWSPPAFDQNLRFQQRVEDLRSPCPAVQPSDSRVISTRRPPCDRLRRPQRGAFSAEGFLLTFNARHQGGTNPVPGPKRPEMEGGPFPNPPGSGRNDSVNVLGGQHA